MATTANRPSSPERERRGSAVGWLLAFLLVAAVVVAFWIWTNDDDSAGPERGVTVEDVADEQAFDEDGFADDLTGRQVTVSGNVSEVLGNSAVRLGGDDFGGDGLLVIGVSQPDIDEGDDVRVTGAVRTFDAEAFETEFGWNFYDDALYDPWRDENVLVAKSTSML